jgi:hypothetical protein
VILNCSGWIMTLNEFAERVFDRGLEVLDTRSNLKNHSIGTLSKITLLSAEMSDSFLYTEEEDIEDWVLTSEPKMIKLLVHTVRLIQACGFDITDVAYAAIEE